ncbi:tRNA m g methyltransferase domain containing protein [Colletotrichum higginsianum]|nr:tRNA m g methyltransferase domain containing protein [Colletotrichum higginsianum]
METPASETVNQPAKDLEMTEAKPEEPSVPPTPANGDSAAANPLTTTTTTTTATTREETSSSGVDKTGVPEASVENDGEEADVESSAAAPEGEPKISKNQLRKMKRKAAWEDGREDRKRKRKEKRHERQATRREEIAALKERFETTLGSQHVHWKGVKLVEGDFVEASRDADELMKGPRGGQVIDLLQPTGEDGAAKKPAVFRDVLDSAPSPDPEPEPADELKNIVYLSSDSVNTLDRLEPNTSYVIGGLVDRNREKGLCHRRARAMGIRTAKLPIGEYMNLSSRRVLATNHVVEIMLKWLETGSWAEAFLSVIPKRKEAKLKEEGGAGSASGTPAAEGAGGEIEDSRFDEEDDEDVDEKQTITENVAAPEPSAASQESNKEALGKS